MFEPFSIVCLFAALPVLVTTLPPMVDLPQHAAQIALLRDVLAGEPSILMRPELYVTAAALAAASYVGLVLLGVPIGWSAVVAASAGFSLRAAAIRFHLALPAYRARR